MTHHDRIASTVDFVVDFGTIREKRRTTGDDHMKPEDPDKPWRPRNTRGRFSYAKTMDKTVPSCYTNIVQSLLASKTGRKYKNSVDTMSPALMRVASLFHGISKTVSTKNPADFLTQFKTLYKALSGALVRRGLRRTESHNR